MVSILLYLILAKQVDFAVKLSTLAEKTLAEESLRKTLRLAFKTKTCKEQT